MNRDFFRVLLLQTLLAVSIVCNAAPIQRSTAILAINDTYSINGVDDGADGGLARVLTLRKELEKEYPGLLVLHAGDLLYPSMLSQRYHGEQMIAVLNLLDGDSKAFDNRLWLTFGNHEFDKQKLKDYPLLQKAIASSQFHWLDSNIHFSDSKGGLSHDRVVKSQIINSHGIKIGLFSITINRVQPAYVDKMDDPVATARKYSARLRKAGAEVVIALTHLTAEQDLALLNTLADAGPDLIVGGHEHSYQIHRSNNGRYVVKADADARSANVVHISISGDNSPKFEIERRDLDQSVKPDPLVATEADAWLQRYDHEVCNQREKPLGDGCLDHVFTRTRVKLVAEELQIRRFETNFGDWIADQALASYAKEGAQIAFINSGSLRFNQDLKAGSAITRADLFKTFAYDTPLALIELDGATMQMVINRAIADWSGNGHWLQIAGFAFKHDVANKRASGLTLIAVDGKRHKLAADETVRAVVPAYLIDTADDQDGYTMLQEPRIKIIHAPDNNRELRSLVQQALEKAGEKGIAPSLEGRICNSERGGECLAL